MLIATSSICGVPDGLNRWRATAVVTVTSNWRRAPLIEDRPHLVLKFADIERSVDGQRVGPRPSHIEGFLDFIAPGHDRLLIHCTAGLGRSPALAIAALMMSGKSPENACDRIVDLVPEASPNPLVLRLAGEGLGWGAEAEAIALERFIYTRGIHGALGNPTGLRAQEG